MAQSGGVPAPDSPLRAPRPYRLRPIARRDVEPAVRLRLSTSLDVVLSRTSAMFIRGERVFRLDDREARKLGAALADGTIADAVARLLAEDGAEPS